ncbi:polyprenyl synthetase family protein [Ruminococcus sp.]|uniref:polyprenyl synthetase family protein n=1 Tax=Ruminococcus sp. TaxID=41978 RepID=UPI00300F7372
MKLENKQELERLVHLVETGLDERLQVTPEVERQKRVIAAMQYSLDAGGKRIRPVLVLEFCRLCGGSVQQAMAAACAIEMIHTFSLIHDDLPAMDNDDFRRGKPSCHKAFDKATAILAGDALSVQAFRVIAEDPVQDDAAKVQLMQILAEATSAAGMIGGQVMDMEYETRDDVTQADLEAMCAAKTGALIRGACRLGCVAAGAPESVVALADQYGAKLGLAFQIVDDILDVTSTTDVLGKPVGSDAEEGKATFVTLLGLERAREEAARLTQEAEELLQQFVGHEFLLDLTDSLLNREK